MTASIGQKTKTNTDKINQKLNQRENNSAKEDWSNKKRRFAVVEREDLDSSTRELRNSRDCVIHELLAVFVFSQHPAWFIAPVNPKKDWCIV